MTATIPEVSLDRLQEKAATAPVGPVLISGGPGTGKTHTLIARIFWMLRSGEPPGSIAYLTANSWEVQDVRRQLDKAGVSQDVFVGTHNQLANSFLRRAGAAVLGLSPHYTIWDDRQATFFLALVAKVLHNDKEREFPRLKANEIGSLYRLDALNRSRSPGHPRRDAREAYGDTLLDAYALEKRRIGVLDRHDLVPMATRAVDKDKQLRLELPRHLLVDQFQDITRAEYHLLKMETGATASIAIATDPNQRTGDPVTTDLLYLFRLQHHQPTPYRLAVNHRSIEPLGDFASRMAKNPSMTGLEYHETMSFRRWDENQDPAPQVLEHDGPRPLMYENLIRRGLALESQGYAWRDICWLFTKNTDIRGALTPLISHGIPFSIQGYTQAAGADRGMYSIWNLCS